MFCYKRPASGVLAGLSMALLIVGCFELASSGTDGHGITRFHAFKQEPDEEWKIEQLQNARCLASDIRHANAVDFHAEDRHKDHDAVFLSSRQNP